MTVEETLASLVDRFNRHAERNPGAAEELDGLSRTIQIRLTDGDTYTVDLEKGRLRNLRSGPANGADVRITTDTNTFHALVRKDIGPMKALVTRKLSIEGSLEDKLLFRKLL
ncbi:MAG TPA: SCP2 sterol-binding domain-containing protein [Thermoplasmata archaeon]|nr:SCP2 sterol-binding domain-containing protein [Thermoplasmata archaeon]HYB77170.1 SCP2 sterol-binding domain-containing protein [Thermoplasmata archaeon]